MIEVNGFKAEYYYDPVYQRYYGSTWMDENHFITFSGETLQKLKEEFVNSLNDMYEWIAEEAV